jgi:hypothetical protein
LHRIATAIEPSRREHVSPACSRGRLGVPWAR